ncbi:MAG: sigma-54 dependent transcriptional regulator [Proteobacteria bacterium]|nr:sigma-54 dependent transcriptional regulator [Pseudomonadota bacterium]
MDACRQEKRQNKRNILVVDDEAAIREGVRRILAAEGYQAETSAGGRTALEKIQEQDFDVVITDLKMPGMDGIEVLKAIKILQPEVPVIIITGYSNVSSAVDAMKNGAFDYIAKPFSPELIIDKIQKAIDHKTSIADGIMAGQEFSPRHGFDDFVGKSAGMKKVYHRILQVAPTDSTVLIAGESGTGKELVARALHKHSLRHVHPFVAVDCSSLPETLLESELFGHIKGSFTGAIHSKIGLFKVADRGTLFLDDISNISLATQSKLMRVLQERVLTPIGDTKPVPTDIRLVVATNINLQTMVANGTFREDLFFRINVIPVHLPPLRERKGDLPSLIRHFLKKYSGEIGKDVQTMAPDAMAALKAYPFQGNVRELENIIERAVVLCEGGVIQRNDLELRSEEEERYPDLNSVPLSLEELKETKKQLRERATEPIEKAFVINALRRSNWNVSQASEATGMLRPNFHALLKKLGISVKEHKN